MRWHIRVGEVEESVTHVGRKVDLGMLVVIQRMARTASSPPVGPTRGCRHRSSVSTASVHRHTRRIEAIWECPDGG